WALRAPARRTSARARSKRRRRSWRSGSIEWAVIAFQEQAAKGWLTRRACAMSKLSRSKNRNSRMSSRKAVDAAEVEALEHRSVVIPSKQWRRFEAWAARPPCEIAGIKELVRRPPTWEE